MMLVPTRHATNETKRLLDNVVLPAGQAGETDLKLALDQIFQHPNVGPFICRRLIQRLVTGNPSPGYVFRTARVFDDNGQGVRGDLQAVVRAILTDHEARSGAVAGTMSFGHQREPVLRVTALMRAFKAFSNTNTWNMGTTGSSSLQQTPLRADTVFNFYEPDYAFPGPIAAYGLVSPEFQITSESTAITAANYVRTGIYNSSGVAGDSSRGFNNDIELDFTHEVSLATNVTALVNHLDLLLMAGRMPADMRSTVSSYLGTVTATNYTGQLRRVQAAVHLISTSSQCVIQP
jgi:hypothetical protein